MWLFIGPPLLSGIGQVTHNYAKCTKNYEYVEIGKKPEFKKYEKGFAFILPIESQIKIIDHYSALCDSMIYMTVCETDPVNSCYGILEKYKTIHVPSKFSKEILENQFPNIEWKILHHWAPIPIPKIIESTVPYIFYTIGNVADPRKNVHGILESFIRCEFPNALFVIKATCKKEITLKIPNVIVINGLISEDEIDVLHNNCHCYINCSHSEGVGMGAVEAALRNKPVIIADYGGLKEYVKTPWMVPCTVGPIGFDDFLFTKDLNWGFPNRSKLQEFMKEIYENKLTEYDHTWTRNLVEKVPEELINSCSVRGDPVVPDARHV